MKNRGTLRRRVISQRREIWGWYGTDFGGIFVHLISDFWSECMHSVHGNHLERDPDPNKEAAITSIIAIGEKIINSNKTKQSLE